MASNKIANGHSILVAIPAGGCVSGGQVVANSTVATAGVPMLVGNDLVGIPESTFAAGVSGNVVVQLSGAYGNIILKTGDTPAVGDKLYFDSGNGYLTTTNSYVFTGWCYSPAVVVGATTVCGILLKKG